jgi:hypothetical protein
MVRSLCGENVENAVLNSANILDPENRRKAKAKRLFGVLPLPIVAAQTTD